jgi:rfaE bifunctional protein kinase chain/domain
LDYDRVLSPIDVGAFEDVIDGADVCVLVDYGKGSLSNVRKLIEIASKQSIWTLVDPKGHDWRRYAGVDVIKPNRDEMREMVGGWSTNDELLGKVNTLQNEARIGNVLLTLGEQGMLLIQPGKVTTIAPRWVDVVCHSGAGEASIAALAVALAEGSEIEDAAYFAARAGEAACTRFGTTVVTREEVFNVERVDSGPSTFTFAH